jgi:trehalose 6-phosphate phosphatase
VLLAFDFDGTLAPIVSNPSRARMRRDTRRLLADVAHRYPCVVISGRRLDEVTRLLNEIPVWYVFGNFGHEPADDRRPPPAQIHDWTKQLNDRLSGYPGIVIEEKQYSVTVHYRRVRDKRRGREAIQDVISGFTDARALASPQAITLVPQGGPDKGTALQQARRLFACDTAMYVGDDDTDEDAFVSDGPGRLLSIRVGRAPGTRARYALTGQSQIDTLLEMLLALRPD